MTDKELYDRFIGVLREDGHLVDEEALSSFKLALSLHSTAPRIEAHYQYYNTSVEPSMMVAQDAACPIWIHTDGKQYCSPGLEHAQQDVNGELFVDIFLVFSFFSVRLSSCGGPADLTADIGNLSSSPLTVFLET